MSLSALRKPRSGESGGVIGEGDIKINADLSVFPDKTFFGIVPLAAFICIHRFYGSEGQAWRQVLSELLVKVRSQPGDKPID